MDFITLLKYLSIPFVAGCVGWFTNWVAIKLMFYPLAYVGIKPIGWQGIIPSKSEKITDISVGTILDKICTVREISEAIDNDAMTRQIIREINTDLETYVDEAMMEEVPKTWGVLPLQAKQMVYARVRKEVPAIVNSATTEIQDKIEGLLDLKGMCKAYMENNKHVLVRLFLEVGEKEFSFIIKSGFYFGFLFGLLQMITWYYYPEWWVLPLFGLFVGFATNIIAIKIIFTPTTPTKIGPFTFQGLFMKRQEEVSDVYSTIITDEIYTIKNITHELIHGKNHEYMESILIKHFRKMVDRSAGMGKPFLQLMIGMDSYSNLKEITGEKAYSLAKESFKNQNLNANTSNNLKVMMQERMRKLSSEEFQGMLRPAFEEDEWKLILGGAVLGLIAGVSQLIFVFS